MLVLIAHVRNVGGGVGPAGVGLFFALSGYLITGLLVDGHSRGEPGLSAFYVRRAARLVPALLCMLVVCDLGFACRGVNLLWPSIEALYVANYITVANGVYLPGYSPTWSLAVEEHFYIVWPLMLRRIIRRGHRHALAVTLLLCAVSLVVRIVELRAGSSPLLAYVGTIERADALLYGCAAALGVRLGWRPGRWLLGPCLLVMCAVVCEHGVSASSMYLTFGQSLFGIAASVAVASIDLRPIGLLKLSPIVRLGVVSYGVYLWHYPLITLLAHTHLQRLAAVVLSVIVASLSYRFVEQPIRTRAQWRYAQNLDRPPEGALRPPSGTALSR